MGLLDIIAKVFSTTRSISDIQQTVKSVTQLTGTMGGGTKSVALPGLPTSLAELQSMPEASLTDEYKVAALAVAVLCNYENDATETFQMMDFLRGPQPLNAVDKQFISDRLKGRDYIIKSYLKGATPDNNYTPDAPYAVEISENSYSRQEKDYVKLFVQSSGADTPRPITLRQKASTGQWFVWEMSLLTDVRQPKASDPWA